MPDIMSIESIVSGCWWEVSILNIAPVSGNDLVSTQSGHHILPDITPAPLCHQDIIIVGPRPPPGERHGVYFLFSNDGGMFTIYSKLVSRIPPARR